MCDSSNLRIRLSQVREKNFECRERKAFKQICSNQIVNNLMCFSKRYIADCKNSIKVSPSKRSSKQIRGNDHI